MTRDTSRPFFPRHSNPSRSSHQSCACCAGRKYLHTRVHCVYHISLGYGTIRRGLRLWTIGRVQQRAQSRFVAHTAIYTRVFAVTSDFSHGFFGFSVHLYFLPGAKKSTLNLTRLSFHFSLQCTRTRLRLSWVGSLAREGKRERSDGRHRRTQRTR